MIFQEILKLSYGDYTKFLIITIKFLEFKLRSNVTLKFHLQEIY